jgi:hypothetical protein
MERFRKIGRGFRIHFSEINIRMPLGHFFENRRKHPTRSAPFRPKIQNDN